jgi:hypothetical protein
MSWPGCSAASESGELLSLCSISCMRKLARGSGDLAFFKFDVKEGKMETTNQEGFHCHNYAPPSHSMGELGMDYGHASERAEQGR